MIVKSLNINFLINLLSISFIFLIDRLSKIYVVYLDNKELQTQLFSSKYINIQLFWNEGIAFGLFSLKQGKLYNFLTIIIIILIIIILYLAFKSNGIKKYSLLLIFGGAIGNLYDRIFYNAVPDFIDLHIGDFHWFIFNVADIFITTGVIFMILLEFTATNNKLKI